MTDLSSPPWTDLADGNPTPQHASAVDVSFGRQHGVAGSVVPADPIASIDDAIDAAIGRLAPAWPLDSFVAVNPYLGMSDLTFEAAARKLALCAGATSSMDPDFYLEAIERGDITEADLRGDAGWSTLAELVDALRLAGQAPTSTRTVPTVAAVATQVTGHDWSSVVVDRIGSWAAAYFDLGQASWAAAERDDELFRSWRHDASVDRTPEILGLTGFRRFVGDLPDDPADATDRALDVIGIPGQATDAYLLALLLRVRGWSAHVARLCWESGLAGREDDRMRQWIAVILSSEAALLTALAGTAVPDAWESALLAATTPEPDDGAQRDGNMESVGGTDVDGGADPIGLLIHAQEAYDRSEQRRWVELFDARRDDTPAVPGRPLAQAVFCIDVRSEVMRRHVERVDDRIETLGFAGFFGLPIDHVAVGHDRGEAQCPVLIAPQLTVAETEVHRGNRRGADAATTRQHSRQVHRAWKSFKMGAVSCFSFVGPVGLAYLPKLVTDSMGVSRPVRDPEVAGLRRSQVRRLRPTLDASDRVPGSGVPRAARAEMAENMLRGMSLVDGFAPIVLLVGHGSSSANNPFAAGLDCGACGGHSGLVNARVAADLLNDREVRDALAARGIAIPSDTRFVAARHDTTTDDVEVVDVVGVEREAIDQVCAALRTAGAGARRERAERLGISEHSAVDRRVRRRARDWAQVRPEWGLAGCSAFIAAPRRRTASLDLQGRAFLHSYDWRVDEGFSVLESIITAPMVVADWINLQYFASTVDPEVFGAGDKTLHNVIGRFGVLEGAHGDLRTGLPMQSVHDGSGPQHQPVRLTAVIEAPTAAIGDVLDRHPEVDALCRHGWISLFAMGEDGRVSHRYAADGSWEATGA